MGAQSIYIIKQKKMDNIVIAGLKEAISTSKELKSIIINLKSNYKKNNSTHPELSNYKIKTRNELLNNIQNLILNIIESFQSQKIPTIKIRNQNCWANCICKDNRLKMIDDAEVLELKFSIENTHTKFDLIVHLIGKIYVLLSTNKTCTKRELYYQDVELTGTQSRVDGAIDSISCLLRVPPWELGVYATSKGLVAGPLKIITSSGSLTDCSVQGGALVPQDIDNCIKLQTEAEFVLLIEKDTVFQKLLSEHFLERYGPCILVTGKGVPDMNTRVLVKCLHDQLSLPIFMLADADPYGIEIMAIYRFGSKKLAHLADLLAVPSIIWIGIHPTDIDELKPITEPLSKQDIIRARSLLSRPYMSTNRLLFEQVNFLMEKKRKSKIENIGNLSNTYLTNVYIPMKILTKQFI